METLVEPSRSESQFDEITHAMRLAGGYDVVVRRLLLQHKPHSFDIVASETPVALGVEVSQVDLVLKTLADSAYGPSDFTGDESFAPTGTLMIE
jgi:hypothetical protein